MIYHSTRQAMRDYYGAHRGAVSAVSLEPTENEGFLAFDDTQLVLLASIGQVLGSFEPIERALLQWEYDPYFEARSFEWEEVCRDIPLLRRFANAASANRSRSGRDLGMRLRFLLMDAGVVKG